MNRVAILPADQRFELFQETALRRGQQPAIIEKDFWVCWTLRHLFDIEEIRSALLFKGGTALAKVFDLIKRFSEDIDLAVDYAPLGFTGPRDPASSMSRTKRERLLDEMMSACRQYIAGTILPSVRTRFGEVLGGDVGWSLEIAADDPNTVRFTYPTAGLDVVDYIRPVILLELGTHAELIPSGEFTVTPFAAEEFRDVFDEPACSVNAIKAERTFWEKATILHAEHHRPPEKPLPGNHARHYYDMAMLARSPIGEEAAQDLDLLRRVVEHKRKFYYTAWARYDLAVPGTLSLVPPDVRISELRRDYEAMSVMMFGDPPPLEDILAELATLETRINRGAGN